MHTFVNISLVFKNCIASQERLRICFVFYFSIRNTNKYLCSKDTFFDNNADISFSYATPWRKYRFYYYIVLVADIV